MLSDPRGNAREWFVPTHPYNAEADLLYLDALTQPSWIRISAKMATIDPHPTTQTNVSVYFTVTYQGVTTDYNASAVHDLDGTSYYLQNDDTQAQPVMPLTGSADPATSTYVINVPRRLIGVAYPRAVLTRLGVVVSQQIGPSLASAGFGEQDTGLRYRYVVQGRAGC